MGELMRKNFIRLMLTGVVSVPLLASCTEAQFASHLVKQTLGASMFTENKVGHFKVGKPYKIKGQWYRPAETYDFAQTGVASWYGPNFHGKDTANGEVYNQNDLTAAHKTLQLPSIIRVTNLENGRSIVLRVNDRGPYSKNRILDVSSKAADLLGFKNQGTAKIRMDVLPNESRQVAQMARQKLSTRGIEVAMNRKGYKSRSVQQVAEAPSYKVSRSVEVPQKTGFQPARSSLSPLQSKGLKKPTQLYVQAGAFSLEQNAKSLVEELKVIGQAEVHSSSINGKSYYRVRFGPFASAQNADVVKSQLANYGRGRAVIVAD